MDSIVDLKDACLDAADYLRRKHVEWNGKQESKKDRIYSGEREFIADVYSLLVTKDPAYRKYLLVDYLRPEKEENNESATPDLVYRGKIPKDKWVVEAKVIVDRRVNGDPMPMQTYLDGLDGDYEQLKEHYHHFDRKFMVVAYLGDIEEDDEEFLVKFKETISELYPDTAEIKVIPC